MIRKTIVALMIAASAGTVAVPATAKVIYVEVAPPAVREEAMPAPRRGHVWAPGHWGWRGHRHVWVSGHWVRARPGYRYYAPSWREHRGRWALERGRWAPTRADRQGG